MHNDACTLGSEDGLAQDLWSAPHISDLFSDLISEDFRTSWRKQLNRGGHTCTWLEYFHFMLLFTSSPPHWCDSYHHWLLCRLRFCTQDMWSRDKVWCLVTDETTKVYTSAAIYQRLPPCSCISDNNPRIECDTVSLSGDILLRYM